MQVRLMVKSLGTVIMTGIGRYITLVSPTDDDAISVDDDDDKFLSIVP
jgi:hypothetical protein